MAHIIVSVLGLNSTLQTLLTSFDKKVGLKARCGDLRVRILSNNTAVTAYEFSGGQLSVSIFYAKFP